MISSLKNLIYQAKNIPGNKVHDVYAISIDLINSMMRHFSIIAIVAYLKAGAKDKKINQMIAQQLPWPTDGSWKNILQKLASANESLFPEKFYYNFLEPLNTEVDKIELSEANDFAIKMLEYASSGDKSNLESIKSVKCSPLEFFEIMVSYRNVFIGHGTQMMSEPKKMFAPHLRKGAIALCNHLSNLWNKYPIYRSEKAIDTGAVFHRLLPVSNNQNIATIDSTDVNLKTGRLYVFFDDLKRNPVSLYPLALWDEDDIFFLNGSKNYKDIRYLGYVCNGMRTTDKHETAFCEFILPFMGGASLRTSDLSDARALGQSMQLMEDGWVFPRLYKGMEIGSDESKYRLIEKIGSGGMAVVWRAFSVKYSIDVAIKILRSPANMVRFRREARALKKVSQNCPYIVKFIDFQFDPHPAMRIAFLVMELLPGETLETVLNNHKSDSNNTKTIPTNTLFDWLEDTLNGLKEIHKEGAIHRDIKPSNIMLNSDNRVKLADFGLVGFFSDKVKDLETTTGVTEVGNPIGTYAFSSFEQLQSELGIPVNEKSDLYSVGATFYYVITGKFPFGTGLYVIINNQRNAKEHNDNMPVPLSKLCPERPKVLNDIIMNLINVDQDLRWDINTILQIIKNYKNNKSENINLNIIDKDVDSRFNNLMSSWNHWYLLKFWKIFIFVELLMAATLSIMQNTFFKIVSKEYEFIPTVFSDFYPFIRDTEYLIWHVLPIISIFYLSQIVKSVQSVMQDVHRLDKNTSSSFWDNSAMVNKTWSKVINSKITLILILLAAVFGCYTTYQKTVDWESIGVYWSDPKISIVGFLLKESLVFVNYTAFLYFLLFIISITHICAFILRGADLSIDLYHVDRANGLSPVRKILLLYLPIIFVFNYTLSIITVINESEIQHYLMYFGILGLVFAYYFLMFWPLIPVHRQIKKFKTEELKQIKRRRISVERKIRSYMKLQADLSPSQIVDLNTVTNLLKNIKISEWDLYKHNTWPIERRALVFWIFIGALPIFIIMLF